MEHLDKELSDNMIDDSRIPIRIAFIKPDGSPNIISLWYELIGGKIYCATQKKAKIVSYLEKNPRCGFEIAADKPPYKGLRGSGLAKIIPADGKKTLSLLMTKYLGDKTSTLSQYLQKNLTTEVAIEITPEKIVYYDYSKRMKDA
ncbi:MAG TPA: pyridoxamine 5'-phosphate oxidase family protein [Nitrosopumilus sp.]